MGKAVKAGLLLLVVTTLVWLTTLWRWETSQRELAISDVVLYLAILPLVLTAALLSTAWAVGRLRTYATQPHDAGAAGQTKAGKSGADTIADGAATAEAERRVGFAVLAATAHARGGSDWAGMAEAVGSATPTLDAALRDARGVAVFTARMDEAAPDAIAAEVDEATAMLSARHPDRWAHFEPPAASLRALALLRTAFDALLPTLAAVLAAEAEQHAEPAGRNTAVPGPREVQLRIAIPLAWPDPVASLFTHCLNEWASAAQPQDEAAAVPFKLHVHPVETADAFWAVAEQQMLQWHRDEVAGVLLLLAGDSLVAANVVAEWAEAGALFSGERVNGRIPGEAAAGLMLASQAWLHGPVPPEVAPIALVNRASLLQRDKSADAAGRPSSATLQQAVGEALEVSETEAAAVQALSSDVDHRGGRSAEVFETLQVLLPHLDNDTDLLRAAVASGDVGVARLLLIAALAVDKSQEADGPVLAVGVHPAHERFAAVLRPFVAPAVPAAA